MTIDETAGLVHCDIISISIACSACADAAAAEQSEVGGKAGLHLVVLGHVDAGKSTLRGRLLHDLGLVDQRTVHKHEKAAAQAGKVRQVALKPIMMAEALSLFAVIKAMAAVATFTAIVILRRIRLAMALAMLLCGACGYFVSCCGGGFGDSDVIGCVNCDDNGVISVAMMVVVKLTVTITTVRRRTRGR